MDFATIPRQGPTSRTLESNSKPEPIAEKDGKDQANPVSLLPLTLFRKLKKDYKLFWPHGDLEVQPGVRPIGDEECYELLKRGWARIDDAPRSNRTNLFYAALRAQRRHSHGSTSVIDFVAIKEIVVEADRDLVRDRKAFENAKEEFKHLSKIEHCHIIASLDMFYLTKKFSNTGTTQHHFVILLYPLAKRNLDQHLKILSSQLDHRRNSGHDVVLDEAQALKLINYLPCLCQAVLYLHNFFNPKTPQKSSPIRHRDIKPQNILIDTSEEILLADFDISKQYEDTESAGTWGNTHVTDEYAAGVLLVEGQETKRSFETDVISLGFVCLEILTVILGASRDEMFRSFPSKSGKYGRGSFAHGKALELGATWEWIRTLLKRARTGQVPEKLKGNVVVLMIRQIILMMRADFGAKGVLEEAYACFSGIADPCEHCKRESGNAVKCRSKSTTPTRLACKNQNSVRYAHSASDLRTTTMPLRHSPLRRIQSNHQIDAGGMSQTIPPICCTLCERHPYMLSRPTQPLQSNGGLAQHSCRLHDHPRCDEEASAHDVSLIINDYQHL
jgi:serine/threonine protein kinase